jgi:hypothetical protein
VLAAVHGHLTGAAIHVDADVDLQPAREELTDRQKRQGDRPADCNPARGPLAAL